MITRSRTGANTEKGGFKSPTPDRTGSERAGSEEEGGQAGRPERESSPPSPLEWPWRTLGRKRTSGGGASGSGPVVYGAGLLHWQSRMGSGEGQCPTDKKQWGVTEGCGRYAPLFEQSTLYSPFNLPISLVAAHMSLVRWNDIRVNKALCPGRSRRRGWLPTAWVPERRTGPRERLFYFMF